MYDPQTDYWQEVSKMPKGLTGLTVHEVDGRMYLVGGGTVDAQERGILSSHRPAIDVFTPVKAPIYSLKTTLSNYGRRILQMAPSVNRKMLTDRSGKVHGIHPEGRDRRFVCW